MTPEWAEITDCDQTEPVPSNVRDSATITGIGFDISEPPSINHAPLFKRASTGRVCQLPPLVNREIPESDSYCTGNTTWLLTLPPTDTVRFRGPDGMSLVMVKRTTTTPVAPVSPPAKSGFF